VWVFHEDDLRRIAQNRTAAAIPIHRDREGNWLPASAVQRQFGISAATLTPWRERACHHLDGRAIRAKKVSLGVAHRYGKMWVYLEADLEKIAIRRSVPPAEFWVDKEGTHWIPARVAVREFGVPTHRLHYWRIHRCWHLTGNRIRAKQIRLPLGKTGERHIWVYHEDDLKQIAKARNSPGGRVYHDSDGTWYPGPLAEAVFGIPFAVLSEWREKGCPPLGGTKIRAKRVRLSVRSPQSEMWVYHEADLMVSAEQRRSSPLSILKDAEGTWLTAKAARERYGIARSTLCFYRNNCTTDLPGRRLRAKQVYACTRPNHFQIIWVYSEEEVREIVARRENRGHDTGEKEGQSEIASEDLVTTEQVSKLVHLSVRTVEKYRRDWPEPQVSKKGSAPAKWSYPELLPTLKEQFPHIKFPEKMLEIS
jgi:hypothetical protein